MPYVGLILGGGPAASGRPGPSIRTLCHVAAAGLLRKVPETRKVFQFAPIGWNDLLSRVRTPEKVGSCNGLQTTFKTTTPA